MRAEGPAVSRGPGRIKCGRTRDLLARAQAQGFVVTRTRGDHLSIRTADGDFVSGGSTTTSDTNSYKPLRAALRRAGYVGP